MFPRTQIPGRHQGCLATIKTRAGTMALRSQYCLRTSKIVGHSLWAKNCRSAPLHPLEKKSAHDSWLGGKCPVPNFSRFQGQGILGPKASKMLLPKRGARDRIRQNRLKKPFIPNLKLFCSASGKRERTVAPKF